MSRILDHWGWLGEDWDAALHPHGALGRWARTGSGPTGPVTDLGQNVSGAVDLLGQGKLINLNTLKETNTLLGDLRKRVREAKRKGLSAPNFNLCDVSVTGTNLFCRHSKGIPRLKMPQLSGVPVPGTPAAALPMDGNGEVDLGPGFRDFLLRGGHRVTVGMVKADRLKATQNELNGGKVAGMVTVLDNGGLLGEGKPIFVSQDGYIVDGHHRWAAEVGKDLEDGKLGDVKMPVERVDMNIRDLLPAAESYAERMGMPSVGLDSGFHFPPVQRKSSG